MMQHARMELSKEGREFFKNNFAKREKIAELVKGGVIFPLDSFDTTEAQLISQNTPINVYIGPDVTVGKGTYLWPGIILLGKTHIGEGCYIGPHVILEDVEVGDGATLHAFSYIRASRIGKDDEIWPFISMAHTQLGDEATVHSHIRAARSKLAAGVNVESFSSFKDTEIGPGKVSPYAHEEGKNHRRIRRRRKTNRPAAR